MRPKNGQCCHWAELRLHSGHVKRWSVQAISPVAWASIQEQRATKGDKVLEKSGASRCLLASSYNVWG
jgi:hypothetical protein